MYRVCMYWINVQRQYRIAYVSSSNLNVKMYLFMEKKLRFSGDFLNWKWDTITYEYIFPRVSRRFMQLYFSLPETCACDILCIIVTYMAVVFTFFVRQCLSRKSLLHTCIYILRVLSRHMLENDTEKFSQKKCFYY